MLKAIGSAAREQIQKLIAGKISGFEGGQNGDSPSFGGWATAWEAQGLLWKLSQSRLHITCSEPFWLEFETSMQGEGLVLEFK